MNDGTPKTVTDWLVELHRVRDSFADTIASVDEYERSYGCDDAEKSRRAQAERRAKLAEMDERIALFERLTGKTVLTVSDETLAKLQALQERRVRGEVTVPLPVIEPPAPHARMTEFAGHVGRPEGDDPYCGGEFFMSDEDGELDVNDLVPDEARKSVMEPVGPRGRFRVTVEFWPGLEGD